MGTKNKQAPRDFIGFITHLQSMIDTLPTNAEKLEIETNFNNLILFLEDIRNKITAVPSVENINEVTQSLQAFEDLFKKAELNPILSSALGLSHRLPKKKKPAKSSMTEEDTLRARNALSELELLPIDSIRTILSNEAAYSLSELRNLAVLNGFRSVDKLSRESLIHQIAMKIANYRGYKQLSGEEEDPAISKEG